MYIRCDYIETPEYGKQTSLPTGHTIDSLRLEMAKPAGKRQIEFFEVLVDRRIAEFCYYVIHERWRAAEIATIFLPAYRGKGLTVPTILFLKKHAQRHYPGLLRIEATSSSANAIAISTLLSAGFKIEGIRPAGYVRGDMISDAVLFGVVIGEGNLPPSSLYHFDSFTDRKKERARLMMQGKIVIEHEAKLLKHLGVYNRFASARQIIDVGCGFGQFADWLSKEFSAVREIVAVDPSRSMIRESEGKNNKKIKLFCSDGLKFIKKLPLGKTDVVCMRFVINHIPLRLWDSWLASIKRCLKPGGILCLTLADANYYKTCPEMPLMDAVFEHKKLLREKNGGIWNVPSVIGRQLHAAGYHRIVQESVCITTEDMGASNYAASIGDQFVWGIENSWGKTGELARKALFDASKRVDFWGQVKIGVHVGEKP